MASNRIKGITIEIGGDTTKLDKALKGTDRNLYTIQKDLQAVERLLKMDPGNTDLLAQKQRLLADAASEAAKRFDILSEAAKQSNQALAEGKIDIKQYTNLGLEVDLAAANLKNAERALADFNDEMSRTSGPAGDAAGGISDLGNAASGAKDGLDGFGVSSGGAARSLGGLSGIAAGVTIGIGLKLVEAVKAAAEWMWSLDEATEEYREAMGKLNTAFEAAGFNADTAKNAYEDFYRILGDTDTATEASQLLAQLIDNEEDIAKWTEIAAGVYGTFGDALPIEGLIEAANETAKTGKVTGVLADALNWAGISEDKFNKQLEFTSDSGYRANMIMAQLTHTYGDAADAFYKNNEVLIESREVQMQLDETQAALGESVADLKNKFFDLFGPALIEGMKLAEIALEGVAWVVEKIGQALDWLGQKISDVIGFFRELFGVSNQASDLPVPEMGSGSRSAAAAPYALRAATAENLPYLARGTVTRPNSPFMAVIGDNPQEPEIVSPLSTIRQAVRDVVGEGGGQASNIRVTVNFTGSAAQLVRMLQPQIVAETNRLGPQYVK